MQTKLFKLFSIVFLVLLAYAFPSAHAYATPSVLFDPTSATVTQNATFQVTVKVNVDSNNVLSSDAIINFAGADLTVQSVTGGSFFPSFSSSIDANGKVELHGYETAGNSSITGNGTLATIVFKGTKSSGSSALSFACTGGTTDTNILSSAGQNILSCSQLNTVSVSYAGSDVSPTLTPTPTTPPGVTPTNTSTPTPTQVPGQNAIPTCVTLASDISVATSPVTVTFTCSGVDSDGDITAASFDFGDGSSQTISKNVGSPGSLSTSHTYSTIGAVRASCLVRDNNQVWSPTTTNCQKIVTLNPALSATPIPKSGSTATLAKSNTGPVVVALISDTPAPTMEPIETLTPTIAPAQKSGSGAIWWVIGVIALIGGFILLRRKKTTPNGHIPPINPPTGGTPQQPPIAS